MDILTVVISAAIGFAVPSLAAGLIYLVQLRPELEIMRKTVADLKLVADKVTPIEARIQAAEKEVTRLNLACEETWQDLEKHRSNAAIHFNQQVATQVEQRQSERMGRIESDVREIKEIVKGLAAR